MKQLSSKKSGQAGFSLMELLVAMTIMMVLLGIVGTLMSRSMSIRNRESRRTDALTSAQAALNVMSREISNAGFGIYKDDPRIANNGLIPADSNENRIHFRTNIVNQGFISDPAGTTVLTTDDPGEDVTYFFDAATDSIVRYDPNATPTTSVVVNRISNVRFRYFNYVGDSSTPTISTTPTADTGRVQINVTVQMDPVVGQPDDQVSFTSEVTLRNSAYMLRQY